MLRAVADTHTVIWYLFDDRRLSSRARATIEEAAAAGDQVGFSSITLIEIVYLAEKDRIPSETFRLLVQALQAQDAVLLEIPLDHNVAEAMHRVARKDVPDLPDRVIAATALHFGIPIVSRDGDIRLSGLDTIW